MMSDKNLIIKQLKRVTASGESEELVFTSGVNVIVGGPNAGKTVWLSMLDYLLGDKGSAEDAFGSELAKKYCSVKCHPVDWHRRYTG